MSHRKNIVFGLIFFLLFSQSPLQAYWVWSPEQGKFVNPEGEVEDNAEDQYDIALSKLKQGDEKKAMDEFRKLVETYPDSAIAGEAQFKYAELLEKHEELYAAFLAYQKVLNNYPRSERVNEILERQYDLGHIFLSGTRAKFMGVKVVPAMPKAIEVFEQVYKNAPFSEIGEKALYNLGMAYKKNNNIPKAIESFERLIEEYPDSTRIPDAKYQLGEVAFISAGNPSRSMEGIERADYYFSSFASDPNSPAAKKAQRLKQEIDSRTAEKNFRVGEYYEKQGYVDSALIYYEQVAQDYPQTEWGKQAVQKKEFLRTPDKFVKEKENVFQQELERMRSRRRELEKELSLAKEEKQADEIKASIKSLDEKQERLEKGVKSFHKNKAKEMETRWQTLQEKGKELKEKRKKLQEKKKELAANNSKELRRFFKEWEMSLVEEDKQYAQEIIEFKKLRSDAGGGRKLLAMPFGGDDFEDAQEAKVDDLEEVYDEQEQWRIKKEELYDFRREILRRMGRLDERDIEILAGKGEFKKLLDEKGAGLKTERAQVEAREKTLAGLEEEIRGKKNALAEMDRPGIWSRIAGSPVKALAVSGKALKSSAGLLTFTSKDPAEKLTEAREKREAVIREGRSRKSMLEALKNSALTGEDAEVLLEDAQNAAMPEELKLKKRIRLVEKEIRWRYQEIRDRNKVRHEMVDELEKLLEDNRDAAGIGERVGRGITAPVVKTRNFFKAFLFGLEEKEVAVGREARQVMEEKNVRIPELEELKEKVEIETLLIGSRAQEIKKLKIDLEALKKEGEKYPDFTYRSAFFELPGTSIDQIVHTADKVLPETEEEQKAVLAKQIAQEEENLAQLREDLKILNEEITRLIKQTTGSLPAEEEISPVKKESADSLSRSAAKKRAEILKNEIGYLEQKRKSQEEELDRIGDQYRRGLRAFYEKHVNKKLKKDLQAAENDVTENRKLYEKEQMRAEEDLVSLLKQEEKLLEKKQKLLEDRKQEIAAAAEELKEKKDYRFELLQQEGAKVGGELEKLNTDRVSLMDERQRLFEMIQDSGKIQG